MSNTTRPAVTVLAALAALVAASRLDFIGGHFPQSAFASPFAQLLSKVIGNGAVLIAAAAVIYFIGSRRNSAGLKAAGASAVKSIVASSIAVQALKFAFGRPRPAYADTIVTTLLDPSVLLRSSGRFDSFPSGHTTVSFAVAYAIGAEYPRLRPLLYALASLVGLSRVYLGAHYPSDVAGGAILGIIVGYLSANTTQMVKDKRLKAFIVAAALFISFFRLGGYMVFDVDEAVFSEASREMLETNDFVTPTYNYEPRYDKPALIYWLMSTAFRLFGVTEFAARFTSAAFGVLIVVLTFFFVKRMKGVTPAVTSSLVLLLNIEFFVYSHSSITDMTLGFFIAAALYSFYAAHRDGSPGYYLLFWVFSASAVLTKGAIGIVFPFSIACIYLILGGRLREIKRLVNPLYIIMFFAIALPWFIAEYYVNGWEFIDAFIIKHHIKRYTEVISSHGGPFYYYIGVLLIGFFPWVAFIPRSLYRGVRQWRDSSGGLYLFAGIWFVFVFIFFSAASTKLPNYIFPLMAPAAILAGLGVAELIEDADDARDPGTYIVAVISAILAVLLFTLPFMRVRMEITLPATLFISLGVIFLAITLLAIYSFTRPRAGYYGIFIMMAVLLAAVRIWALPPVNSYLQKDLYLYSSYAKDLGKDVQFAAYGINRPSLAFYAQKKVAKIEKSTACDIKEFSHKGRLLIVTEKDKLPELQEYDYMHVIDTRGRYALLANFTPSVPLQKGR